MSTFRIRNLHNYLTIAALFRTLSKYYTVPYLNIYKYQIRSNLSDTLKWYRNHGIISQSSPYSAAGWHHNLQDTALAFIKLQIAYMTQPFTIFYADYFLFPKFTKTNQAITSSLPIFILYDALKEIHTKKIPFLHSTFFLLQTI